MTDTSDLEARLAALEARVQELEDDRALRGVLARYGIFADTYHDDEFVDLYTDDAAITMTMVKNGDESLVSWRNKEGIREFTTHPNGHGRPELHGKSMHLQGNNLVTHIDGDDAVVHSYSVSLVKDDAGTRVLSAGNNRWQFRKIDGTWRIKERRSSSLGHDRYLTNLDGGSDEA